MPRDRARAARAAAKSAWNLRFADEAFDLIEILGQLPDPHPGSEHAEAARLFREDQSDRTDGNLAEGAGERDRIRRRQGLALLTSGQARSARDYYHLAMLFQHGGTAECYHLAHELAQRAAAAGHRPALWLAAAAHDRWLMHAGLPQRFGTQYHLLAGRWVLYSVDPTTEDDERARWDVPPLTEALQRAEHMNEQPDQP